MMSAYQVYRAAAQAKGETPLSQAEWLASLRGITLDGNQTKRYAAYVNAMAIWGQQPMTAAKWLATGSPDAAWVEATVAKMPKDGPVLSREQWGQYHTYKRNLESVGLHIRTLTPGEWLRIGQPTGDFRDASLVSMADVGLPASESLKVVNSGARGLLPGDMDVDQTEPHSEDSQRIVYLSNWSGGSFNTRLGVGMTLTLVTPNGQIIPAVIERANVIRGVDHDHGHEFNWTFTDYHVGLPDDPFPRGTSLLGLLKADLVRVYSGELPQGRMLYREHRGSLQDSMETVKELDRTRAALSVHLNAIYTGMGITAEQLIIAPHAKDDRIGWDTYIVSMKDVGVLGFVNGPVTA